MEIWEYKTHIRFVQETLVQSSMKDTSQRAPNIFGIGEGPQTLLWIKWKGFELILLLIEKVELLCLASSHTSQ